MPVVLAGHTGYRRPMTSTPDEPEFAPDPDREVPEPLEPGEDPSPYPDDAPGAHSPETLPI